MLETADTVLTYAALGFSVAAILIGFHLQSEIHRLRARIIKLEIERRIYNESDSKGN